MKLILLLACLRLFSPLLCASDTQSVSINLREHSLKKEIYETPFSAVCLPLAYSYESEHHLISDILSLLEAGRQIKGTRIDPTQYRDKNELFTALEEKHTQFYIAFCIKNHTLIWKIYSIAEKKFLKGKSYPLSHPHLLSLQRTVAIDIWQELFGESYSPFHCFLSYLNVEIDSHNKYHSCIEFCHPLLKGFEKTILKTPLNILDLCSMETKPLQSLLFSMQTDCKIQIVKLTSKGNMIPLTAHNGMCISPTVNQDGLFYISSRKLYRYYFNTRLKKFCTDLLDNNADYASVYLSKPENI
jgi:hypothetical protein